LTASRKKVIFVMDMSFNPSRSVSLGLQPPSHAGSSFVDFSSTLKLEAIFSSETSVHTKSTWGHIPEDGIVHSHRREYLKSYTNNKLIPGKSRDFSFQKIQTYSEAH
jgi:hypothetical protein